MKKKKPSKPKISFVAVTPLQQSVLRYMLGKPVFRHPVIKGPHPAFVIIRERNTEAFEHKVSEKLLAGYYPTGPLFIHEGAWIIALIKQDF
jgi:hypothetical protein